MRIGNVNREVKFGSPVKVRVSKEKTDLFNLVEKDQFGFSVWGFFVGF